MKKILEYINEALKDTDKSIKDMLDFFAKQLPGVQGALHAQKAKDADSVDIVTLSEVFTDDEIEQIKKYVNPKPKMCYENAYKLADRLYGLGKDIKYVEGYINMKGLPIDHAFNCVDGKYVDCTIELALGKNPQEDTYVKVGEYNLDDVREVLLENGFYGDIYNSIFLKKYKENIKV